MNDHPRLEQRVNGPSIASVLQCIASCKCGIDKGGRSRYTPDISIRQQDTTLAEEIVSSTSLHEIFIFVNHRYRTSGSIVLKKHPSWICS